MMESDELAVVVMEISVFTYSKGQWIDTDATKQICGNQNVFSTYTKVDSGERFYMENTAITTVEVKGNVITEFISEKEMTILDVLYVPKI